MCSGAEFGDTKVSWYLDSAGFVMVRIEVDCDAERMKNTPSFSPFFLLFLFLG